MIETNRTVKQWGMFCHFTGLAGYLIPFGNVLGPLVIWLMKREEMRFIDDQGRQAVNFQLNVLLYLFIASAGMYFSSMLMPFLMIPFFVAASGIGIGASIFTVVAGFDASKGNYYRYPCVLIKFLR